MPFSSRGTLVVDVAGYVPTPEVRDAAIQLVRRETAGLDQPIRIEDRILVNARRHHHAA